MLQSLLCARFTKSGLIGFSPAGASFSSTELKLCLDHLRKASKTLRLPHAAGTAPVADSVPYPPTSYIRHERASEFGTADKMGVPFEALLPYAIMLGLFGVTVTRFSLPQTHGTRKLTRSGCWTVGNQISDKQWQEASLLPG